MTLLRDLDGLDFAIDVAQSQLGSLYSALYDGLKRCILADLARLSKRHRDKEVMLTSLKDAARLHIDGEETIAPIIKRIDKQRAKRGVVTVPIGVFLAVNDNVSFQPIADE